jgi:hypothetical protein
MIENIKGIFVLITIVAFLYIIVHIIVYSILTKSSDSGCTFDCESCPFPRCTKEEKEAKRARYYKEDLK